MNKILSSVLVALAISGCNSQVPGEPIAETDLLARAPSVLFITYPDNYIRPSTPDERRQFMIEETSLAGSLRMAVKNSSSWQEASSSALMIIEDNNQLPAFYKEQLVASMMLPIVLPGGESTEVSSDRKEAIGIYLDMLVRNENPNAEIVSRALPYMRNQWSDSKINNTARFSYDSAEKYLEDLADCEGCGISESARVAGGASGSGVKGSIMRNASSGAEKIRTSYLE